jgi:DNA mismatch repair protein MutS
MRQWTAAKKQNPDALLFFRMGDFYELFYDDAATASRELQLTLTARDRERSIPMCGVPYHAVEQYLTRLLRKGYRIALCDQMEDPRLTKKIVRREVTRVLTPGTALDAGLGQEQNNFLAALYEESHPSGKNKDAAKARHPEGVCALALLDVSTGEFRTAEFLGRDARAEAVDALLLAAPSEVLLAASAELPAQLERIPARTRVEDWVWTRDFAVPLVERQLNVHSLEGFGLNGHEPAAIAAGAVLHYVRSTQKNEALHIDSLKFEGHSTSLELDQVTVRNAFSHTRCLPDADGQATAARNHSAAVERSAGDQCALRSGRRSARRLAETRGSAAGIRWNSGPGAAAGTDFARLRRSARCARARRQSGAATGFESRSRSHEGDPMARAFHASRHDRRRYGAHRANAGSRAAAHACRWRRHLPEH